MQTIKTALPGLICLALLSACGLKGPLYLEDEAPQVSSPTEQAPEADAEQPETTQDEQKKKSDPG